MKLGSLFDGIGGFPLAASRYGIIPVWASEIEPFPIKVTQHHFPNMKHLGDITQINGAEIEPVDIITFGSPCQDLSVAGKREGLQGERSGLFMDAVRIIRDMRRASGGEYPRFIVWENVPGAFSSNRGQDFRAVLSEIAETEIPMPRSGKWANAGMVRTERIDIAWRTLDAQYWGVPQRRKRIFLVADFGGQCAGEILFESEGLRRNIAESREAGEEIAGAVGDSTAKSIGIAIPQPLIMEPRSQDGTCRVYEDGIVPTLNTAQGGQRQPCICLQGSMIGRADKNGPQGDGINEDVSFTLNTTDRHAVAFTQGSMAIVQCIEPGALSRGQGERVWDKCPTLRAKMGDNQPCVVLNDQGGSQIDISNDVVATLRAEMHGNIPAVTTCQKVSGPLMANTHPGSYTGQDAHSDMLVTPYQETVGSLCASDYKGVGNQYVSEDKCIITPKYSVRRLTPLECERLQGFPDGWTDILGQTEASKEELEFWRDVWLTWDKTQAENPEKVKPRTDKAILKWLKNPTSDSAQYKALGNSVAIPCVDFIMRGIKEVICSTER